METSTSVLEHLRAFAGGAVTGEAFGEALYAENDDFRALLDQDPTLPPGTFVGSSVYLYLMSRDLSDPFDVEDARAAVAAFLQRNGFGVAPADDADLRFAIEAQPSWIDVIPSDYFTQALWSRRSTKTGRH